MSRDSQRSRQLSRRLFLHGAGVVMALPWLESAPVWGATAADAKGPSATPQRFVVQFMGTGISPGMWWAKGEGASMELSPSLKPLEPLKTKLNVINGLFNKPSTGVGIHPGMTGNILSGMPLTRGTVLHGGAYFLLCLGSLVTCQVLFRYFTDYTWGFMAMAFVVGGITAAFYGWMPLYLPELFPTRVRATAQGVAYNFGRIAAGVGAVTGAVAAQGQGFAKIGVVVSLIYVVGMAIIWLAPETKGKPLPE